MLLLVGRAPRSWSVLRQILSFFEVCLRSAFVFCVLPVLLITKMNSTQARTCGVTFWNNCQPIHAHHRKRVWKAFGLADHQCWLVENLTAGAQLLRMASVSCGKRAAQSHLGAVFKEHKVCSIGPRHDPVRSGGGAASSMYRTPASSLEPCPRREDTDASNEQRVSSRQQGLPQEYGIYWTKLRKPRR
ncbi:uncharacterized protein LOC142767544 [Rhipicephalus microplus]|uniref:uncharacterized protein LOC142767544 n=1 Tax=Rhipicephalus microplus TaxID=6941 RepID=UPI003F6C8CA7